jgi:Mrp family chromosome partitioning ATPase
MPSRSARDLVALETEYARLARVVAEERELLQMIDTKHFAASMAASSVSGNSSRVKIADPAYLPTRPIGARPKLLLLAGFGLSLLLAIGTCIAFAVFDDRVRDRHDVERLGLPPLLSEVPHLGRRLAGVSPAESDAHVPPPRGATPPATPRGRYPLLEPGRPPRALPPRNGVAPHGADALRSIALAVVERTHWTPDVEDAQASSEGAEVREAAGVHLDPRLVLLRAPSSPSAAAFRVLRHRLVERCGDPPSVVLVTSATADEGKTTCALNLALALAEGGRAKVLLLDANFRRPAVSRILGLLQFETDDPWVAIEQLTPTLHVALDAHTDGMDGHSVSHRVEHLLHDGYDYLVIDGPGVLGSADVNVLEESSSSVVLTVWADRSRGTAVRRAVEQIGPEKLVGVVLMGT